MVLAARLRLAANSFNAIPRKIKNTTGATVVPRVSNVPLSKSTRFFSVGRPVDAEARGQDGEIRWDITPERWVDVKFCTEDFDRFPLERALYRSEPRLATSSLPEKPSDEPMDLLTKVKAGLSSLRLGDTYSAPFEELLLERLAECPELMARFDIPAVEAKSIVQPMHSKAVPNDGVYVDLRKQAYWLAVHVWLVHNKQNTIQKGEGLFISAVCALLTRRAFEFQWNRMRMLMHAADVPIMSVTNEVVDIHEFLFGFCMALDEAFKEEAPNGCTDALAVADNSIEVGRHGLAPRIKYTLWANVYSGAVPHDSKELHELTVYLLRQKIIFEAMPRDHFLSCRWDWGEFPTSAE